MVTHSESEQIARLFAHPLRGAIVRLTADEPRGPKQISEQTGWPLGVVSYHVRQLVKGGALELVEERPTRGSLAHFYKATPFGVRAAEAIAGLEQIVQAA